MLEDFVDARHYRDAHKRNPLSAKFIKWSNTLKQFVGKLPTNCLSVFDHFVGLALKGLKFEFVNNKYVNYNSDKHAEEISCDKARQFKTSENLNKNHGKQ